MKKGFLLILLFIFLTACEKSNNNHRIYFERYLSFFGRDRAYIHWIIDNEGNVLSKRKYDTSLLPNSTDLNEVYLKFDSIIYKVDKAELEEYISLIEPASNGKIDTIGQIGADGGTSGSNCYLYNNSDNSYNTILLKKMDGALTIKNTDSNAIKIANWLQEIHITIYSN